MEKLAPFWNYAPVIAAIAVLLVIAFVVVLVLRSHRSSTPTAAPDPQPPLAEIDPDLIDSSHIGFAPLVGSVSIPSRERGNNRA
jgi:hypothetical protein